MKSTDPPNNSFFQPNPEDHDDATKLLLNADDTAYGTIDQNEGSSSSATKRSLVHANKRPVHVITLLMGVLFGMALVGSTRLAVSMRNAKKSASLQTKKVPKGPYRLIQRQEGEEMFDYYDFYNGPDNVGSNGYINYVTKESAMNSGILRVTEEADLSYMSNPAERTEHVNKTQFVYMGSAPTDAGPRDSIRLEGKSKFNGGLFVIDLHHMPAGCGSWPAVWLSDEKDWPLNGEIDIVEGVNYQKVAKTALHTSKGCDMEDSPSNLTTGGWDTAVGIPDSETGVPDMTFRYAKNCYVYAPHQWTNQGCVATDAKEGNLGEPLVGPDSYRFLSV
uniref:GH16 domain-containing protein n=1 Tax=Corethron hystrix TaxID=216773 RepID=A0A7S1FLU6_9STRA|mmetsp:Transcript_12501/g.27610  ORF Transcript_12501/g.27610 Transcript_12501/m.27610 type:complete len:333 (+) Transcript_12501:114-1112(+)